VGSVSVDNRRLMFFVGLELDPQPLENRGRATVAILHASIVAPFLMGAALALYLYPTLSPTGISFTSFSSRLRCPSQPVRYLRLDPIATIQQLHPVEVDGIVCHLAQILWIRRHKVWSA
jgi:hypothetical protein